MDILPKGTRVVLHPATDAWMQGDRYGVIVGFGHSRLYVNTYTREETTARPYLVKMDRSGRRLRMHPDDVIALEDREARDEEVGQMRNGSLGPA